MTEAFLFLLTSDIFKSLALSLCVHVMCAFSKIKNNITKQNRCPLFLYVRQASKTNSGHFLMVYRS